ncbi:ABC transporter related protein, partial [sediment metagenome]
MLDTYKKIYSILDARERGLGAAVLALSMIVGLVESVGVASLMPFIAVLSDPETVETNRFLATAYDWLGFASLDRFLLFLGIAVFVVLVGSLAIKGVGIWAQMKFARQRSHAWACRLIASYLGQPYEWFLNRHSGELGASVLAEVVQVVTGSLIPALQAASSAFLAVWLFALLVVVDPLLAVSATVVMGASYGGLIFAVKATVRRIGADW